MTDLTLCELSRQWQLSEPERHQLEREGGSATSAIEACLDADRALLWLLGDRGVVRRWLRSPHPAFYHRTPLQLLLGSAQGRQIVRRALLDEAAQARDVDALAAAEAI